MVTFDKQDQLAALENTYYESIINDEAKLILSRVEPTYLKEFIDKHKYESIDNFLQKREQKSKQSIDAIEYATLHHDSSFNDKEKKEIDSFIFAKKNIEEYIFFKPTTENMETYRDHFKQERFDQFYTDHLKFHMEIIENQLNTHFKIHFFNYKNEQLQERRKKLYHYLEQLDRDEKTYPILSRTFINLNWTLQEQQNIFHLLNNTTYSRDEYKSAMKTIYDIQTIVLERQQKSPEEDYLLKSLREVKKRLFDIASQDKDKS